MNARDMISRLLSKRWLRSTVMANWTPRAWWECDVFELTAGNFFREYEVKLSRDDFFADARKRKSDSWKYVDGQKVVTTGAHKHDLLAVGSEKGPSYFWFVTPAGLIDRSELPAWAGLIEFAPYPKTATLVEKVVVNAPRLHKRKREDLRSEVHRTSYFRMHEMRRFEREPYLPEWVI